MVSLDPSTVKIDAARFQFKSGGDAQGVTDALTGVKEWDNNVRGIAWSGRTRRANATSSTATSGSRWRSGAGRRGRPCGSARSSCAKRTASRRRGDAPRRDEAPRRRLREHHRGRHREGVPPRTSPSSGSTPCAGVDDARRLTRKHSLKSAGGRHHALQVGRYLSKPAFHAFIAPGARWVGPSLNTYPTRAGFP